MTFYEIQVHTYKSTHINVHFVRCFNIKLKFVTMEGKQLKTAEKYEYSFEFI